MNSKVVKIISALLALCILTFVGYQCFRVFYSPYKSETVFDYTVPDMVEINGMMFRDETVIDKTSEGVLSYYYPNGAKVSKDSEVAVLYSEQQDAINQYQIKQIDEEISMLSECQNQANVAGLQTEALNKQINEKQLSVVGLVDDMNLDTLMNARYSFITAMNKKQIVVGKEKNFQERIDALKAEKKTLNDAISAAPKKIKTPQSGYFVNKVDGYEQNVKTSMLKNLTPAGLTELLNDQQTPQKDAVGKIITGYDWKFATLVNQSDVLRFRKGTTVGLVFPSISDETVDAVVESIGESKTDKQVVVVFSSDIMTPEISALRTDKVKVNFKNQRGIKVPKEAIRIVNNEKGVYRAMANEMQFVKIDIIYETEDYILSGIHQGESGYLQLYDDVIVKGKDLYDKKPM